VYRRANATPVNRTRNASYYGRPRPAYTAAAVSRQVPGIRMFVTRTRDGRKCRRFFGSTFESFTRLVRSYTRIGRGVKNNSTGLVRLTIILGGDRRVFSPRSSVTVLSTDCFQSFPVRHAGASSGSARDDVP